MSDGVKGTNVLFHSEQRPGRPVVAADDESSCAVPTKADTLDPDDCAGEVTVAL